MSGEYFAELVPSPGAIPEGTELNVDYEVHFSAGPATYLFTFLRYRWYRAIEDEVVTQHLRNMIQQHGQVHSMLAFHRLKWFARSFEHRLH